MGYYWKFQIEERGLKEVPLVNYTLGENKKYDYVEKYLSPSIENSRCGWNHCIYYVLENLYGKEEYVVLYPDESNHSGRYICVSGNSLGAIAEAVWTNVFN